MINIYFKTNYKKGFVFKYFLPPLPLIRRLIVIKLLSSIVKEDLREHQKAYQKAREIMSKNWSSLEGKLILVSGKDVVKKLSE
jgi:hypothetical protein